MEKKPINEVLASNLLHFMERKGCTQAALAEKCKIGQTTISLYLNPERRKPGASGKLPSAKLSEVEMLANGLGVEVWELLRNLNTVERQSYEQIEMAFKSLRGQGISSAEVVPSVMINTKLFTKKRIPPAKNTGIAKAA